MDYLRPKGIAFTLDGVPLIARGTQDFAINPALAAGDVKIEKDGGAAANLATLPVVTPAGGSSVRVTCTADEANADRIVIRFVDQDNPKAWLDQVVIVETIPATGPDADEFWTRTKLIHGRPRDYWDVILLKNGAPIASGVTVPTLTVKAEDGTTLIDAAALTAVAGDGGRYAYRASGTARTSLGVAYSATVQATVNGTPVTFLPEIVGRDKPRHC